MYQFLAKQDLVKFLCFNGMSNFMRYLMPKASFINKTRVIICPTTGVIRCFIPFLRVLVQRLTY